MTPGVPFPSFNQPPTDYQRPAEHAAIASDKDVRVAMRDGAHLVVDVYRPEAPGKFPVLVAFGTHTKEIQGPEYPKSIQGQPAWSSLWVGHMEAGDTRFFVSRGYVHVIGGPRGFGKSDTNGSREWDGYDLVEWAAAQPWSNGKVAMVGIGAFAAEQYFAAKQRPPHLAAIFPYDPRGAYGPLGGFREDYPGGVLHAFRYLQDHFSGRHQVKGPPGQLSPEREALWQAAMNNPDYRMYPYIFNVLAQRGQHMPAIFDLLLDPYEKEGTIAESERAIANINVPVTTGAGWYGYTYKTHLGGAQNYFAQLKPPKKLILTGPSHPERPLRALHNEMLRWYDHWLKGIDTGVLDEPPVRYWVMGANQWRTGGDWPLPETVWTPLYLNSWERLSGEPFTPASVDEFQNPDAFVQMPPTQTNQVAKLRYMTDPLPEDTLVAGPIALTLFASIDQDDTTWIVILKDIGPDPTVRTAREGEREIRTDLPERELTRGWLRASCRELDLERSRPWKPWHKLTRAAREAVVPGEIIEYAIEIQATANLFRAGHRIAIEITSADFPTGVSGTTNVEYIPHHLASSRTTLHKIFHDPAHPSRLLLPLIPT
ncbi:MAG TPA: CocE/NonD family hydrolase [Bauldia sp.]